MRITGRHLCWLAFAAAAFFVGSRQAGAAEATGIWKLVVLAIGEDELAIVDLHRKDGQPEGVLVDGRKGLLDKARVENVKLDEGRTSFKLGGGGFALTFDGALAANGPDAGKVLGTVDIGNAIFPARLEKTIEEKVGAAKPGVMGQDYFAARNDRDAKSSIEQLRKLIEKNGHSPVCYAFYDAILQRAHEAEMPVAEVEALLAAWRREAAAYGSAWSTEVAKKALTALADQKEYAEAALALAKEIDAGLPADASAESRAQILKLLAAAAKNAGKADLAADVAFDGLLQTYKPAEFIGLQYHLHIPGPDPMTSPDTLARARYYGDDLGGTPSTFINGRTEAAGGGSMAMSEGKYAQYREVIDKMLQEKPGADVTLSAKRTGDVIAIAAEAKSAPKGQNSSIKLRLALTEESVRYVGGNKLRFHHHVVRSMPGGVAGAELVDGAGKVELKVDLAELRKKTEEYLSDFAKGRPFFAAPPALDYKNLAVVAFVQDDHDRSILGATAVPVSAATP